MTKPSAEPNKIMLPGCAAFGVLLVLFGLLNDTPADILAGMGAILTMEDVLITDYIAIAGIGAAFVNAGLVTLISVLLLKLTRDPLNGATLVTVGLMAGFSLFGKNILNIWPIICGTVAYARFKGCSSDL